MIWCAFSGEDVRYFHDNDMGYSNTQFTFSLQKPITTVRVRGSFVQENVSSPEKVGVTRFVFASVTLRRQSLSANRPETPSALKAPPARNIPCQCSSVSVKHSFLMRPTRYCRASTTWGRISPPMSTYIMSSPTCSWPSFSQTRM